MSATLGTLVIAVTTEFSVLLSERVRRQLGVGMSLAQAIDDAYRTTGVAVLTSAVTAIAGFGVLVVSNITMLRDFGFLTLVDLSVSLAGVMLVLPAVLGALDREPVPDGSPSRGHDRHAQVPVDHRRLRTDACRRLLDLPTPLAAPGGAQPGVAHPVTACTCSSRRSPPATSMSPAT